MKEKELKVKIPKGYKIDKENSTFECIKFKPIPLIKNLTYEEVTDSLFENCCIDLAIPYKDVKEGRLSNLVQAINSEATYSIEQYDKIRAIVKLFNIAKYYNGDWKYNYNSVYWITYDLGEYGISSSHIKHGTVIFKRREDAQAVIDNPNFRNILDTIFK